MFDKRNYLPNCDVCPPGKKQLAIVRNTVRGKVVFECGRCALVRMTEEDRVFQLKQQVKVP